MLFTIVGKLSNFAWNLLNGRKENSTDGIENLKEKLDVLEKAVSSFVQSKESNIPSSSNQAVADVEEPKKGQDDNISNPSLKQPNLTDTVINDAPITSTTPTKSDDEKVPTKLEEMDASKTELEKKKQSDEDKEKYGDTDLEIPFPSSDYFYFGMEDLIGLEAQVTYLRENVLFPLANQELLSTTLGPGSSGINIPRGIMFHGPNHGMGALAKALAVEIDKILRNRENAKDKNKMRLLQRPVAKTFRKYTDEGGKFVTQLFNQANKPSLAITEVTTSREAESSPTRPFLILIEEIHTLCRYQQIGSSDHSDEPSTSAVTTELGKLVAGQGFLIATTNTLKDVPNRHKRAFDLLVEFPTQFDNPTRLLPLQQGTSSWKFPPSPELLQEIVGLCVEFSLIQLKSLPQDAYWAALRRVVRERGAESSCKKCCNSFDNLKVSQAVLDSVNPTLDDWKEAVTTIFEKIQASKPPKDSWEKYLEERNAASANSSLTTPVDESLSFSSVGGLQQQIQSLQDNIIFPVLHKESLAEWGISPVRGIIFHGPPGTGKTLLGKALAAELSRLNGGEKKFSFFYQKSSDCFNKYVGESERNLRELFANAAKHQPAILFFDEIDGLCPTRGADGNSQWHNSIVTTLLGMMDGVQRGEVFVIAATNRLESIDPAMRRPGRFDKEVAFHLPKEDGRIRILEIHTKVWKKGNSIDVLERIAKQTEGYSGADLEQLCRQAFVFAVRRHFSHVDKTEKPSSSKQTEKEAVPDAATFDDFDVLPIDWRESMSTVKASPSNAFGNSATNGKSLPSGVAKLLERSIIEILLKFSPFLDNNLKTSGNYCGTEKGSGLKSFYVWGNGVKKTKIINYFLIPALLARPELDGCTSFTLDFGGCGSISMIQNIIRSVFIQAQSPGEGKTGIILIPEIDQIGSKLSKFGESAPQEIMSFLSQQIHTLRGENVIILATGAGNSSQTLGSEFFSIFQGVGDSRSHEMSLPTPKEYRELFSPLLQELFPNHLNHLEELASKHQFDLMEVLNLKGEIEMEIKSHRRIEVVDKNLGIIFASFEQQIQSGSSSSQGGLGMYT